MRFKSALLFLVLWQASALAEINWLNPPHGPFFWREISRTADAFFLPSNGVLLRSTNGRNWNLTYQSGSALFFTVAQGADKFIAAGVDGSSGYQDGGGVPTFYISTNGLDFKILAQAPHHVYRLAYGNGRFVASGFELSRSDDGISWQRITSVPGTSVNADGDLIFAGGRFVRSTGTGVYTSEDGITWTGASIPGNRLSYHNGLYATDGPNAVHFSTNGYDWQSVEVPMPDRPRALAAGEPGVVLLGDALYKPAANGIFSADKTNWVSFTLPFGNRPWDVKFINGEYVMIGEGGLIAYSTNGTNWTKEGTVPGMHIAGTAKSADRIIAVGSDYVAGGRALMSTNGTTWQELNVGTTNSLWKIACIGETFVAIGAKSEIVVSTNNGSQWFTLPQVTTQELLSISVAPRGFIVGGRHVVMASTNGIDWQKFGRDATTHIFYDITYGLSNYIGMATEDMGGATISQDLENWSFLPGPVRYPGHYGWQSIEFGNGRFLVGPWVTSDLVNWERSSLSTENLNVTFSEGVFCATAGGQNWNYPMDGYVSVDGLHWTRIYRLPSMDLTPVKYFGRFMGFSSYSGILEIDNFGVLGLDRTTNGALNLHPIHPAKLSSKIEASTNFENWITVQDSSGGVATSEAGRFFRLKLEPAAP